MSKALVIKGASFAANKVETITLSEPIPCTGLSVLPTTVSFTALNATQQLTVTKTPADTTDTVRFASSNESVATVSDSGLITCVGIGSATITVTCGTQTSACTVSATAVIDLSSMYTYDPEMAYSGSIEMPNKDWIGYSTSQASSWRTYYNATDDLGGYRAFYKTTNAGKYLIPIPNGATKVKATTPTGANNVRIILADSQTSSKASGADGQCAAAVAAPISINVSDYVDISGYAANGFVIYVTTSGGVSALDGHPVLTFA